MKKLTSLQIMMLMTLALGSSQMHGEMQKSNMADDNEAVMLEFQAAQDEQAGMEVLTDLLELEPMAVKRIIEDEADLEATFNSIRNFVHKKNTEIDKLNKEKVVNEVELAILAKELADAQAALERAIAKQRAKHKRNHRHEQAIKDALKKAEQGVKSLSKKTLNFFNQTGITKAANQTGNSINKTFGKKKSKSKKNNNQVVMSEESQG